jgi:phospholipid transport system substrate-binding protein
MLRQPLKNLHSAHAGLRRPRGSPRWGGIVVVIVLLMTTADGAPADQPIDALKRTVEDGIRILKDPLYAGPESRHLQERLLREVLYRDFDFVEFSRRALADKWLLFTEAQRVEFVEVFSRFLADYYLRRLQQHYTDETVIFRGQEITGRGKAVVQTHVVWQNREFAVDVRMHLRKGRWMLYDVSVIGISAVQIYRAQLREILQSQSPVQVIELIKGRLGEN